MKTNITEFECMLVVIYKKLDDIENRLKGASKSASEKSYYDELKQKADKVRKALEN